MTAQPTCPGCKRPLGRRRYLISVTKLDETVQDWQHEVTVCRSCVHAVLDALEPPKRRQPAA